MLPFGSFPTATPGIFLLRASAQSPPRLLCRGAVACPADMAAVEEPPKDSAAKAGPSGMFEKVVVHPIVLLSVVDHYNRVAKDTKKRVVGILLGSTSKGVIDVTNCYAVPFEEDERDLKIWYLDHSFHEQVRQHERPTLRRPAASACHQEGGRPDGSAAAYPPCTGCLARLPARSLVHAPAGAPSLTPSPPPLAPSVSYSLSARRPPRDVLGVAAGADVCDVQEGECERKDRGLVLDRAQDQARRPPDRRARPPLHGQPGARHRRREAEGVGHPDGGVPCGRGDPRGAAAAVDLHERPLRDRCFRVRGGWCRALAA